MKEFIMEHWQLIASFVLALFNLVITLWVHSLSSQKINKGGIDTSVKDGLGAVLASCSAILEVLNEKKDQ